MSICERILTTAAEFRKQTGHHPDTLWLTAQDGIRLGQEVPESAFYGQPTTDRIFTAYGLVIRSSDVSAVGRAIKLKEV